MSKKHQFKVNSYIQYTEIVFQDPKQWVNICPIYSNPTHPIYFIIPYIKEWNVYFNPCFSEFFQYEYFSHIIPIKDFWKIHSNHFFWNFLTHFKESISESAASTDTGLLLQLHYKNTEVCVLSMLIIGHKNTAKLIKTASNRYSVVI